MLFLVFALLDLINALHSPPLLPVRNDSVSYSHHTNTSVLYLPGSRTGPVRCSMREYGVRLNKASCLQAVSRMPSSPETEHYGRRDISTASDFDTTLPIRYLSDDGACAVDVNFRSSGDSHVDGDFSSALTLKKGAKEIMLRCVDESEGGIRRDVSQGGSLRVTISKYEPDVQCIQDSREMPSTPACAAALSHMPTKRKHRWFTSRSDLPGASHQRLPVQFSQGSGSDTCRVIVSLRSRSRMTDRTWASWFEIWAGAVAVQTMCIQNGKFGKAVHLGRDTTISVAFE